MEETEKAPKPGMASVAALDRMVEKQDFDHQINKRASKIDFENCLKYIDILHN